MRYRVGIILSTVIEVDADSEEEAEELAFDECENENPELNIENSNFIEEVEE